jgi:hypothetical protein
MPQNRGDGMGEEGGMEKTGFEDVIFDVFW